MSIPVSTVVDVGITIGAVFPARAGFGVLNIVTAETGVIGLAERIRSYTNLDGVVADWASDTEVVAAATAYFSQQPKPTQLKVAVRFPTAQAAQLRGGAVADEAINLALFTAISDGSFAISIDGVAEDITAMDFSAATDMDDVATEIETTLQAVAAGGYTAASCTHDGTRFFINSGTTGASSTVSFLTVVSPASGTDISSLLEMQQGQGTKTDVVIA